MILLVWYSSKAERLSHWGRVMHIYISKLIIIASDNGLSPDRCQVIVWTNTAILLTRSLGTNFNEILIESHKFPFNKIHFKISSGKWRPFSLGLTVLSSSVGRYLVQLLMRVGSNWGISRFSESAGRHSELQIIGGSLCDGVYIYEVSNGPPLLLSKIISDWGDST